MSVEPRHCSCGRELEGEETACPSCSQFKVSWWKQAALYTAGAVIVVGGGVATVLSKLRGSA